jgi:hypothetical protein
MRMKMRVELIEERNYYKIFSFILTIIIIILLLADVLDIKTYNLIVAIFLLPIVIFGYSNLNYRIIGYLDLEDDKIIVTMTNDEKKEINLENVESIKLYEEEVEKYYFTKEYILNFIIDNEERGQIFNIKLKERYLELFKKTIEQWYKKKFNFREYSKTGEKIFLLKQNLSYIEIQKLKENYQINW